MTRVPYCLGLRSLSQTAVQGACLLLGWSAVGASAEIRLPHVLSEHAVLQRERPIHVWGWADPGETIAIAFHNQKLTLNTNAFGVFSGWLAPEKAGGPYVLSLGGGAGSTLTVGDLLVGDVWFASGQSNMEMPLKGFPGQAIVQDADREISTSTRSDIRLLRFDHKASDVPVEDVEANWTRCEPRTAAEFSAVAYLFGREIADREHVPVGLIDATWGGTPIDSWMSLESLADNASLSPVFATRARFAAGQKDVTRIIQQERMDDAAAEAKNQPPPAHPWHPDERSWDPGRLYNGMIAPATGYTIRGFLWYQGETDSSPERAPMYAKLFPVMIADWRQKWQEGTLPFLYVQISSFDSPAEIWGAVRDAQRQTLSVIDTAMAVSLDVGKAKNVHPPDKQTVAHRLALGARALSYGERLEWSGPMYRQSTREGGAVRVWFDHAGEGLKTPGPLLGFELAGADGRFLPATAAVEGTTVLLRADEVPNPQSVRYGWSNVTKANLYNLENLPASTFAARLP